jgi:4a-hydroxytetrahydrobiopterin dehydratase
MAVLLSQEELHVALKTLSGWNYMDSAIVKSYTFKDFVQAMRFVNTVAATAESVNHHPDIDIRWNTVKLALSTHSAGGLTEKDIHLATMIDVC